MVPCRYSQNTNEMKRIGLISILIGLGAICAVSQDSIVTIPDAAFLNALIDEGVDTDGDGLISYGEAETVMSLDVSKDLYNKGNISDMSGIEAFINLETLHCSLNEITSLDVSGCTGLWILSCGNNQLASLDFSNNTDLRVLDCSFNQLTSLNVSNNQLVRLNCSGNLLTHLDLSNNRFPPGADLNLSDMPTLGEVLVWTLSFRSDLTVDITNSPNVYFSDYLAPEILIIQDPVPTYIYVTMSENGFIYLVPEGTENDIDAIRAVCIDSISALAKKSYQLDVSGLDNGVYWFYARDRAGNISEPEAFTIEGVGVENEFREQFRIFPNPVQNLLFIETNGNSSWSVEVTSLNGQMIYSKEMEGTTDQIDFTSFTTGVYFITIVSKDFVTTRKIIKL